MSSTYISAELRRQVISEADNICEYCLIHEDDTFFGCHVDHIISEKHGGLTTSDNLAFACSICNLRKGSDIASLTTSGILTRLYNPRIDVWPQHFALLDAVIESLTDIGEVTVSLLQLNASERVLERQELIKVQSYPSEAASIRLRN
ncbi:MAG: HNH endonuclease signature motif containing protein [Abditibacteriaceae bacterium]